MKKLFLLLAAAAMVLAFSMPAAAIGHVPCCENCDKCDLDDIDCPATAVNVSDECGYFDYDSPDAEPNATKTGAVGYVDDAEAGDNENCKVIFDICCCDADAIAYFVKDQTIGVRMTSLTDGFYFTDDDIHIDIYEVDGAYCTAANMAAPQTLTGAYIYKDAAGEVCSPAAKAGVNCSVLSDQKAVVVETDRLEGYQITQPDIDDSRCKWWFDMPAMRYDFDDATRGDRVYVQIELMTAESGICSDWKVICTCIVDLGVWCPETVGTECIYFPYVLPGDTTWSTGIALTNLESSNVEPADMEATFTLTDMTGAVFTYTKDDFTSVVWSTYVNLIEFEEGIPATGPAWLRVNTNFNVDGYQFLTDGTFGAGTLPRTYCP